MNDPALLNFVLTYAGVALGRIPVLLLDRTGIALLGAIAMIFSGAAPLAEAVAAIDLPTIILLYALMVISAQLRLGGLLHPGRPGRHRFGQFGRLDFAAFFAWCAPPTLLALAGAYGIILYLYRQELRPVPAGDRSAESAAVAREPAEAAWPAYNRWLRPAPLPAT